MLLSQSRPSHLWPVLQVSQCARSRMAFHPKGLCITDRGSHPEMSRGTVSRARQLVLGCYGSENEHMDAVLSDPQHLPHVSHHLCPHLAFFDIIPLKAQQHAVNLLPLKLMKRLHFGGRCSVEGKFYLCSPCSALPHLSSHTSDHAVYLFHGIFFKVFAQIVRTCYILEVDFAGFSRLYIEATETSLTQTSCL